MRYLLSKRSVFGCFLCVIGVIFTIQGIKARNNLETIKESYSTYEINDGCYIECDISKEQLIGQMYTDNNGAIKYGPYCGGNVFSSSQTYIVAVNKNSDYYVPLIVRQKYQKDFESMIDSDDTYPMLGRFEKFRSALNYDIIAECLGTNDRSQIDQMISTDHQIRLVDSDDERIILYKGLSLLIIGLLLLFSSIEKQKVYEEES